MRMPFHTWAFTQPQCLRRRVTAFVSANEGESPRIGTTIGLLVHLEYDELLVVVPYKDTRVRSGLARSDFANLG